MGLTYLLDDLIDKLSSGHGTAAIGKQDICLSCALFFFKSSCCSFAFEFWVIVLHHSPSLTF